MKEKPESVHIESIEEFRNTEYSKNMMKELDDMTAKLIALRKTNALERDALELTSKQALTDEIVSLRDMLKSAQQKLIACPVCGFIAWKVREPHVEGCEFCNTRNNWDDAKAQVKGLRLALDNLLVSAIEFFNDWEKGDFELPKLAQCDMRSMADQFGRAQKVLTETESTTN